MPGLKPGMTVMLRPTSSQGGRGMHLEGRDKRRDEYVVRARPRQAAGAPRHEGSRRSCLRPALPLGDSTRAHSRCTAPLLEREAVLGWGRSAERRRDCVLRAFHPTRLGPGPRRPPHQGEGSSNKLRGDSELGDFRGGRRRLPRGLAAVFILALPLRCLSALSLRYRCAA